MSVIGVSVTEARFSKYIEPSLSKARRGYVCRIGLYLVFNAILYKLHTGCQWSKWFSYRNGKIYTVKGVLSHFWQLVNL
jgi:transposase